MAASETDIADCIQVIMVNDDETEPKGVQVVAFVPDHKSSDGSIWCSATAITIAGQTRLAYLCIPPQAVGELMVMWTRHKTNDSPQTQSLQFNRTIQD